MKYMMKQFKQLFISTVILHHAIPGKRFYLETYASNVTVGSHLFQLKSDGQKAVIGFVGRTLKGAGVTYFTTEKELLADLN